MGSPEAAVERHLVQQVRQRGGICEKLAPTHVGMPDRIVILPGGRIVLVEVKTTVGRLRPAQEVWALRAREIGAQVDVVYGRAEVNDWVSKNFEGS